MKIYWLQFPRMGGKWQASMVRNNIYPFSLVESHPVSLHNDAHHSQNVQGAQPSPAPQLIKPLRTDNFNQLNHDERWETVDCCQLDFYIHSGR